MKNLDELKQNISVSDFAKLLLISISIGIMIAGIISVISEFPNYRLSVWLIFGMSLIAFLVFWLLMPEYYFFKVVLLIFVLSGFFGLGEIISEVSEMNAEMLSRKSYFYLTKSLAFILCIVIPLIVYRSSNT